MAGIYSWLKSIVIFMILLTIISNLLGKSDFKKYINVVTGLLLVLVTMSPILKLITKKQSFDFYFDSISFDLQTTEVANEMKDAEVRQKQQIMDKYKKEITDQVEDLLKKEDLYLIKCDVLIDEEESSETYAQIKSLGVKASYYIKDNESSSTSIDKVEIEKIFISDDSEEKESKQKEGYLTPMEIHIKTMLSDFYNMDSDNINISIQGG